MVDVCRAVGGNVARDLRSGFANTELYDSLCGI